MIMERLITALMSVVLTIGLAAAKDNDLARMKEMNPSVYIEAGAPMLKSGFYLPDQNVILPKDLTKLQMVVLNDGAYWEEGRKVFRKAAEGLDVALSMTTNRANIVIYGNADKNYVYHKVVVGIGGRGSLVYIYMEGNITGRDLSTMATMWQ